MPSSIFHSIELPAILRPITREDVPLAPFTTFRIGGNARWFAEPRSSEEVIAITKFVTANRIPFFILGNGSNVLISDEGWDGLVMNLETGFNSIAIEGNIVTVGAGMKMAAFVDQVIRKNLKGVEMLSGIPATIGGAVRMNAGCYGGETSDYIIDVGVIRNGKLIILTKEECNFSYRHTGFETTDSILSVRFALQEGVAAELQEIKRGHLLHRNQVQPVQLPNCGSVFKNPKPRFSAELIESVQLKGFTIGGAQISTMHGNFIVNINRARATDVVALMNLARKKVFAETGIILEPEVQLIGFLDSPLELLS